MLSKRRELLLKVGAGAIIGIFLLDKMIISPALAAWKEQGERLAAVRQKVERGRQLLAREDSLRGRWDDMQKSDLADDHSAAENDIFKAINRWNRDSRVGFTSLTPQWRSHEEGYDTFELRATAVGDQSSLGRLIYEIESDPLPARVEDCEITTRDAQGKLLGLTVRFSFVRLSGGAR